MANHRSTRIFYGWWIVVAAFLNLFFAVGIIFYGFPVFYPAFVESLGFTRAQVTQGFLLGFLMAGLPFGLLAGAAIAGGSLGSHYASRRLPARGIQWLLAIVLILAAANLILAS